MKKYWILLLMLLAVVACNKEEEGKEDSEILNTVAVSLSLSGTIANFDYESTYKLQLIEGNVDTEDFDENYTYHHAQIFVTEKNKNNFKFDNLQEGIYTLITTKRGYKASKVLIDIKKDIPNFVSIKMEKANGFGLTNKLQILDEDGNSLSKINIHRFTSLSVFFYLYNDKGTDEFYRITYRHNEGYLARYFIINGKSTLVESSWIKKIKPHSGILKPNEIQLVEVEIDPFTYVIKEHSKCDIEINQELKIELTY